jgi:hypothetical protein
MNVLILHHFSDYWSEGLNNAGTDFDSEIEKVLDYLEHEDIDKVILPLFEQHQIEECHYPLANFCQNNGIELEVHEYNYAWSKESDHNNDIYTEENFNKTWCYGTREGHGEEDVIEIDNWQVKLRNASKVIVAGAFENECVLDLETALDAIGINYEREEGLIVGTFVEYEFRGQTNDELREEIEDKLSEIEDKVENKINFINEEYNESISDLDELHIFYPEFMSDIETEINDIFDEYEEILEKKDFRECLGGGYIADLSTEVFTNHEHSEEYQDTPDEHIEKMVEVKIRKVEHNHEDFTEIEDIKEFIELGEDTAEMYFQELDDVFEELKEKYGEESLVNIDIEDITTNRVTDDYWNNYLIKNETLNIQTLSFLAKKELEENLSGTYYHGTSWELDKNNIKEIEEEAFIELDTSYTSLEAIYISESEEVADWFVTYSNNNQSDLEIPVVFKFENININKIYDIDIEKLKDNGSNSKTIRINGKIYDVAVEREDYFRELENDYNGVMIKNNYPDLNNGHDIAIFNENLINDNISAIKMKINNEWTDYMNPEDAVEIYKEIRNKVLTPTIKRKRAM